MDDWKARIKRRRKLLGMTQDDLGLLLGVDQTTIAGWKSGRRYPDGEEAFDKLAAALECSAAWLRYGVGDDHEAQRIQARLDQMSDADKALVLNLLESLSRKKA